jgi:hypothetical protein
MSTFDLDCGSQGNLLSQSTKKNGADYAPFFLRDLDRDRECDIRGYLERHLSRTEIATKMCMDPITVDKYLSTLRSSL